MNTAQQRIDAAGRLSILANKSWTSQNREILAYVAEDRTIFWKAMGSFIQLESGAEIQSVDPSIEAYTAILNRAFLTLLDDGTISLAQPLSSLAQTALNAMRIATGIGEASVPAPVVELTPEQKLENEVIADFARLSGDAFRAKLNGSVAYRHAYRKLADEGRINVGLAAPKAEASTERELSSGERLVKIDQTRFVRHIDGAQVSVTEDRALALALTGAEAQQLATRLRRGHFPQAAVVA